MEGFGHYINEARSIGALVVTLDAPPMNELIDSTCGVLIPTTRSIQHNHGLRFIATPEAIEQGILAARRISVDDRKRMGGEARKKFLNERRDFVIRLCSIIFGDVPTSAVPEGSGEQMDNAAVKRRAIFQSIYSSAAWGRNSENLSPFYSGAGSHDWEILLPYFAGVEKFLASISTEKLSVVDFGCGDFSVGSRIRLFCGNYIACDIVPELIEFNRKRFSGLGVDFRLADLVSDPLPMADVVFVRQVLQHLSNSEIIDILPKIKSSYRYMVLTEHVPRGQNFLPNKDKRTGSDIRLYSDSGVVLTSPPFNLEVLEEKIICEVDRYGGVIRTTAYRLR
jgi:SAM-dependent methyltransferase